MFIKDIPVYARDFKNEYLFILHINNELKYFLDNLNNVNTGLFDNHRVDKIKKSIERFFIEQNLSNFKDVSNFEIKSSDVKNLIKIKKFFNSYHGDEHIFVDPYPGFKNISYDFELFCSKFKINMKMMIEFGNIMMIVIVIVILIVIVINIFKFYNIFLL